MNSWQEEKHLLSKERTKNIYFRKKNTVQCFLLKKLNGKFPQNDIKDLEKKLKKQQQQQQWNGEKNDFKI